MKENIKKRTADKRESFLKVGFAAEISSKQLSKIFCMGGTQTNGRKKKKVDDTGSMHPGRHSC